MTEARRKFNFKGSIYYVTSGGHVENSNHHRISLNDNGNGYLQVSLNSNGKRKNFYVHRLVAISFIPNPNKLPEVNHIDGNKSNNSVNNLEWVTSNDNKRLAAETGLVPSGLHSWNSKLNWDQFKLIFKSYWAGIPTIEICKAFNLTRHTVLGIAHGTRYKKEYEKITKEQ